MSISAPAVSVVIPTRDRWPLLSRALRSALGQRDVPLEVVVADDGSADETPEQLVAMGDPRVRHVRHEITRGVSAARNSAAAAARGEWIAFLDDDDLWAPHKLAEHLRSMAAAGADWGWSGVVWVDEDLRLLNVVPAPEPEALPRLLPHYNAIGTPSCVIVRRALLDRVGGFDERVAVTADWDLWLRLAARSRGSVHHAALVAYVEHAGNMHLDDPERLVRERRYLGEKHDAGGPDGLGGPHFGRWVAYGHRRMGRRRAAGGVYLGLLRRYREPKDAARVLLALIEPRPRRVRLSGAPEEQVANDWLAPYRSVTG